MPSVVNVNVDDVFVVCCEKKKKQSEKRKSIRREHTVEERHALYTRIISKWRVDHRQRDKTHADGRSN